EDPRELVSLIYAKVFPAIANAYREHAAETNPLVDYPTRRILRFALLEIDEAIQWGDSALAAIPERRGAATPVRVDAPFAPQRDERFHGLYNFDFPPHVVYNMANVPADERNLALLCTRALEMDV